MAISSRLEIIIQSKGDEGELGPKLIKVIGVRNEGRRVVPDALA